MEGTGTLSTDTGSATTGPATFSDASLSWADAPSASDTASDSTAAAPPADATAPPAATETPEATPANGEPPKERWPDILANARAKERESALNEWRQKHGWAEQVEQREFQQIQRIARALNGADRVAGLQELVAEISREDPNFQAQLRSWGGRLLAQRQQQHAEHTEPQPDLPIQLEDGRVVHLYSAEQQAKREAFLQQQWLAKVQQDIQPLKQSYEQQQQAAAALAEQQAIAHDTSVALSTASKWKGMDDPAFRAKVAARLGQIEVASDDRRDVAMALRDAYIDVRAAEEQTLTQKAEARTLDTLQRKAAASTSVNPGSAATATPKRVDRFSDLPASAWKD